jgi:hypothetical protein
MNIRVSERNRSCIFLCAALYNTSVLFSVHPYLHITVQMNWTGTLYPGGSSRVFIRIYAAECIDEETIEYIGTFEFVCMTIRIGALRRSIHPLVTVE